MDIVTTGYKIVIKDHSCAWFDVKAGDLLKIQTTIHNEHTSIEITFDGDDVLAGGDLDVIKAVQGLECVDIDLSSNYNRNRNYGIRIGDWVVGRDGYFKQSVVVERGRMDNNSVYVLVDGKIKQVVAEWCDVVEKVDDWLFN